MTTATTVYLVPSRGRPHNIAALLEAWTATRSMWADLVIAVDDDDPTVDAYRAIELPVWAELVVGPRLRLGGTLNALAPRYAKQYAGVGFMGDDHRPRTPGWDRELADELNAETAPVVYANDLVQGQNLPTAVLLDSLIVETLGYFVPPGMTHLWLDNYWLALGRRLNRLRYRPDVVIEHVHPITGRAEWDDSYRENNGPEMWEADEARFHEYMGADFEAAARSVLAAIADRRLEEARNG